MAYAQIRANGLKALQEKLRVAREQIETVLTIKLLYLGEQCQTHAKEHKGYHDRTANLKNSISYALYKDGQPVKLNLGSVLANAQNESDNNLKRYFSKNVESQGFTLMIAAGMHYGRYVENRGYNVLTLTRYFMEDKLKDVVKDTINEVLNGKI